MEESIEKPVWVDAMVEEYESIVKNCVWELVPRPADKSKVGSRWIFKVKSKPEETHFGGEGFDKSKINHLIAKFKLRPVSS